MWTKILSNWTKDFPQTSTVEILCICMSSNTAVKDIPMLKHSVSVQEIPIFLQVLGLVLYHDSFDSSPTYVYKITLNAFIKYYQTTIIPFDHVYTFTFLQACTIRNLSSLSLTVPLFHILLLYCSTLHSYTSPHSTVIPLHILLMHVSYRILFMTLYSVPFQLL